MLSGSYYPAGRIATMTGVVFDIKEFAVFDGPGIRTTVFMKGCPLRCRWCHNPEGLSIKPELMVSLAACKHCGACARVCPHPNRCVACGNCIPVCRGGYRKIVGTIWDETKLSSRLSKDRDVYAETGGGVTFSGGEPLLQWDFVARVIKKMPGIHTAIETSGYASDAVFQSAMETCSLIMMDWKVSDPEMHMHFTGVSQEPIRRHAEMLCASDTPFILRMPIIPGVNDNEAHFETVAKMVRNAKSLLRIDILPYQKTAGAKYEMVGRQYDPGFDDTISPKIFTHCLEERGIPYQLFH